MAQPARLALCSIAGLLLLQAALPATAAESETRLASRLSATRRPALRETGASRLASNAEANTPTPERRPFVEPFWGRVAAPNVNVRWGPGTEHGVVATLHGGDYVRATAQLGDWYEIEWPTAAPAWISRDFVNAGGNVTGTRVRVRAGASLTAPVLREVNPGDHVEVLEACGNWYKLQAPAGAHAYLNRKLAILGVRPPDAPVAAPETTLVSAAASAGLSAAPSAALESAPPSSHPPAARPAPPPPANRPPVIEVVESSSAQLPGTPPAEEQAAPLPPVAPPPLDPTAREVALPQPAASIAEPEVAAAAPGSVAPQVAEAPPGNILAQAAPAIEAPAPASLPPPSPASLPPPSPASLPPPSPAVAASAAPAQPVAEDPLLASPSAPAAGAPAKPALQPSPEPSALEVTADAPPPAPPEVVIVPVRVRAAANRDTEGTLLPPPKFVTAPPDPGGVADAASPDTGAQARPLEPLIIRIPAPEGCAPPAARSSVRALPVPVGKAPPAERLPLVPTCRVRSFESAHLDLFNGVLEPAPDCPFEGVAYRLVQAGNTVCYVFTSRSDLNLDSYVGRRIEVLGTLAENTPGPGGGLLQANAIHPAE